MQPRMPNDATACKHNCNQADCSKLQVNTSSTFARNMQQCKLPHVQLQDQCGAEAHIIVRQL